MTAGRPEARIDLAELGEALFTLCLEVVLATWKRRKPHGAHGHSPTGANTGGTLGREANGDGQRTGWIAVLHLPAPWGCGGGSPTKRSIKEKEIVLADLEHIRENFKINYLNMKAKSGLLMRTVASHGDYVNRKLKLTNIPIVSETVRTELGIIREAYDEEHMNYLTYRLADHNSRNFTQEAIDALSRRESVVELLIHPRQWKSDFIANTRENINRIYRGLLY